MKPILYIILISSLITNLLIGVIAYQSYKLSVSVSETQEALKQPIETLNKVSKKLSIDLKNFSLDEIKESYDNGYLNEKKEQAKNEIDTLMSSINLKF